MTDIRALLRAERAARAPAPAAPKSRKAATAPTQTPTLGTSLSSKKRKASSRDDEEDDYDSDPRKRNLPAGFFDAKAAGEVKATPPLEGFVPAVTEDDGREESDVGRGGASEGGEVRKGQAETLEAAADVDADEWAAFQAFTSTVGAKPTTAAATTTTSALDALQANATLEAAPQTTEEAAAQAKRSSENQTQQGKREAEIEEEKEDAAERLEEEFEVMGELEDRIRRLKEKREVLRRASGTSADGARPVAVAPAVKEVVVEEEEEGEIEDEVDEFEGWRFGGRRTLHRIVFSHPSDVIGN